MSLFIPNISKEAAIKLGVDEGQESIIYKDDKEFSLIGTNKNIGIGKVLGEFEMNAGKDNFDFSKDTFEYVFSQLLKGSHRNKKFAFKMK